MGYQGCPIYRKFGTLPLNDLKGCKANARLIFLIQSLPGRYSKERMAKTVKDEIVLVDLQRLLDAMVLRFKRLTIQDEKLRIPRQS